MEDSVAINMTELPRVASNESARERNPELDAEMEKVFQPPVRFAILDTSVEVEPGHSQHYDELDYERHRHHGHHHHHHPLSHLRKNKSFPRMSTSHEDHQHQHHRASTAIAAKISTIPEGEMDAVPGEVPFTQEQGEEVAEGKDNVDGKEEAGEEPKRSIPKFTIGDPDQDKEEETQAHIVLLEEVLEENEDVDKKDHHKHHHHHHRYRNKDNHQDHLTPDDGTQRHHHHRHKHHYKKHSTSEKPELRCRKGSTVNIEGLTRVPTELDEAMTLQEADLEDMAIHRLADAPGVHRHKVTRKMSSIIHIGQRSSELIDTGGLKKKEFDHRPHEVFVELDELFKVEGHDMQWKEKARWIKFEEDVEEGSDRWGKPHVASLTFHSLLELRKHLGHGATLLDLEETQLSDIFHRVAEKMAMSDQILEENIGDVLRALQLKHKHVNEHHGLLKNFSTVSLTSMMSHHLHYHHQNDIIRRNTHSEVNFSHLKERHGILKNVSAINLGSSHGNEDILTKNPTEPANIDIQFEKGERSPMLQPSREEISIPDLYKDVPTTVTNSSSTHLGITSAAPKSLPISRSVSHKLDQLRLEGIMRKIPPGAEATTVLVGEVDFLKSPALVFVRLAEGTLLENFTEVPIPVRFVFVMLGPSQESVDYHELGRCFSTLMSSEHFHETAYSADCMEDLLSAMNEFIDDSVVLPAGNWDRDLLLPILRTQNMKMKQRRQKQQAIEEEEEEAVQLIDRDISEVDYRDKTRKRAAKFIDPLKRTGCLFGGVVNDIKRRYPWYLSDLKDAVNLQCFAALFFIFFAALSPAITFGGLLGDKTKNYMGVSEMIIGTSICGVVFAIFSCQPLIIIGATGPLLVFEENLYSFCASNGIEYLPFRAWVGVWIFVISTLTVALEGSVLVRFFTRFTEDIFSFLISLIFINEVFKKLLLTFKMHPLLDSYCPDEVNFTSYTTSTMTAYNTTDQSYGSSMDDNVTDCAVSSPKPTNMPNTALLSTILMLGTFFFAYFLRILRNSRFLGKGARKTVGDFGIPIAIIIMVLLDFFIAATTYTEKLEVPNGLEPTDTCLRGWFVNPLGMKQPLQPGLIFGAIIPAFLAFILIYMEALITSLIINKNENKLKKGSGFHTDLWLLGGLACFSSFFGLPWMCSATVRSVTHTGSLTVYSRTHAPGEKPHIEGVREQRVTAFLVNLFIGLSIALAPLLRQVPLAVLFGVFLYMGIVSLNGIQLVDRVLLMLMPVKHHPDVPYTRKVRTLRMHIFTGIQLLCLAILWVVKSTPAALAFPFFLILLVPVRRVIARIFTPSELEALDGVEAEMEDDDEDEYQVSHMPV